MTQIPLRLYFALLPDKRQIFADCLSGDLSESSIRLRDIATGLEWWGSNGGLYYSDPNEINRTCLNQAEAWFMAIGFSSESATHPNGIIMDGNTSITIPGSPDPGFDAFLVACGLEYWTDTPPPNNGNIT